MIKKTTKKFKKKRKKDHLPRYVTDELFVFKFSAVTSTPSGKYLTVLTAVLTRISKPSVNAIGTHEYPLRTVK